MELFEALEICYQSVNKLTDTIFVYFRSPLSRNELRKQYHLNRKEWGLPGG